MVAFFLDIFEDLYPFTPDYVTPGPYEGVDFDFEELCRIVATE